MVPREKNLRRYIFTELERKLLWDWLRGKQRSSDRALDNLLVRVQKNWPRLQTDFRLLMRVYAKLPPYRAKKVKVHINTRGKDDCPKY